MFAKLFFSYVDSEIIVHPNVLRGFLVFKIIKINICGGKTTVLENYSFHKLLSHLCSLSSKFDSCSLWQARFWQSRKTGLHLEQYPRNSV